MPTKETMELLKWIENVARRCICCEHYFGLVTGLPGQFWPLVQNALGEAVCVFWSHLFGKRAEDLHYSQFFAREDVAGMENGFSASAVKDRLVKKIGFGEKEYEDFWKEVKNCRDQFVAHKDVFATGLIFPRIQNCRIMVEELRVILEELVGKWHAVSPRGRDLENWKEYYAWNSNKALSNKCQEEFRKGVLSLGEQLGKKTLHPLAKGGG
jgi:hypothetical protein